MKIRDDENQTQATRIESSSLHSKMEQFETALLCILWDSILHQFNAASQSLQATHVELATCVSLYDSLVSFIASIRDKFEDYEKKAKILVKDHSYSSETKRQPKRKRTAGESENDHIFSGKDQFRVKTYLVILDSLNTELIRRKKVYSELNANFGFLYKIKSLTDAEVREAAKNMKEKYPLDFDNVDDFTDELIQFSNYLSDCSELAEIDDLSSPMCVLNHLRCTSGGSLLASFQMLTLHTEST